MTPAQKRRARRLACVYPALARMPRPSAYALAGALGRRDARRDHDLRTACGNGFRKVWPALAPAAVEALLEEHSRMLAHEVLDAFMLDRLGAGELASMVDITGLQHLVEASETGRGVLLAMAHHSRLILFLAALGAMGRRLSMLTMRIDETNAELSGSERVYLARKVAALRRWIGGDWLSLGKPLRPLYDGLARGDVWIVLFDAHHPDFGRRREHPFLGGMLSLPTGLERIMARTGAAMVYAGVSEHSASRLSGRLLRLPDAADEAMAAAVVELERDVRAAPAQWWHWNILDYIWRPVEGDGR